MYANAFIETPPVRRTRYLPYTLHVGADLEPSNSLNTVYQEKFYFFL